MAKARTWGEQSRRADRQAKRDERAHRIAAYERKARQRREMIEHPVRTVWVLWRTR